MRNRARNGLRSCQGQYNSREAREPVVTRGRTIASNPGLQGAYILEMSASRMLMRGDTIKQLLPRAIVPVTTHTFYTSMYNFEPPRRFAPRPNNSMGVWLLRQSSTRTTAPNSKTMPVLRLCRIHVFVQLNITLAISHARCLAAE